MFFTTNNSDIAIKIYDPETKAICSIEKLLSIKIPKSAVPNAVENTINAVVSALMEPIYLTPYISAQVAEPKTFAKPFEIPIKPKNINDEIGELK